MKTPAELINGFLARDFPQMPARLERYLTMQLLPQPRRFSPASAHSTRSSSASGNR